MGNLLKSIIAVVLVLSFGCVEKAPAPENLLSKEAMANLLIEMYTLESRLTEGGISTYEAAPEFYATQQEIFARYNTDSAQYYSSYSYYMDENFAAYKAIYDVVLDTLEKRKSLINNELNGR